MALNNFIYVSKRQARKVLSLYTLDGCTQEQIGACVFPASMERRLPRNVLARRVLHVFGLRMGNRRTYHQDGLTPAIIEEILSNPFLPFPLMIPVDREPEEIMSFSTEVSQQINGGGRYSSGRGFLLNVLAVLLIGAIQFVSVMFQGELFVVGIPLGVYVAISLLADARADERNKKRRGDVVMTVLILLFFIFCIWMGSRS